MNLVLIAYIMKFILNFFKLLLDNCIELTSDLDFIVPGSVNYENNVKLGY